MDLITYIFLGIIILLLLLILFKNQNKNKEIIKFLDRELEKKQSEIRSNNSNMIQNLNHLNSTMNDSLLKLVDSTSYKLNQLENSVNEKLLENTKANAQTLLNIGERITKIDDAQKNLKELSTDIISLQNILQDKKSRGTFGEIELYSLLESSYGINNLFWEKQYLLSNGTKVDAVLKGNDDISLIPIDSKFPLENYQRIYSDDISKDDRNSLRKQFKNDVIKHLNDINSKYIIPGETSDFAYMFVPAEAIYSEIYTNYPDVVELSYKLHVYIVSPTTLMAYLTAIRSIYLGQERDKNAKEILAQIDDLSIEFKRFAERNEKMKNALETYYKAFGDLDITTNKIINKFNKIKAGNINEED